jgi:ubiquinone/menaquinone biosynthesis C-methylase UbiE
VYDRYADSPRKQRGWAAQNPGNRAIREELLAAILVLAGDRLAGDGAILDVGCGSGWLLSELAQEGIAESRLHGIDLLPRRVAAAAERVPGAELRVADARALPFEDDSISVVVMLTCLSSMPDHQAVAAALAQAKRVTADGGAILVYEPRVPNPFNRATLRISPKQLRSSLAGVAETTKLTALPPLSRRLGSLTPRLYPWLARVVPTHRLHAYSQASR